MTQPDPPIILDLDPTGYIAGMNQSTQATDGFGQSLRSSTAALAAVPLVMRQASSHIPIAGFTAFAMVAGRTQQQLSPLRATTKALDADFGQLNKGINRLARDMPIGNAGAREMVTTMTRLGVATRGQERNVVDLAKVYTKLGGATGEGPVQLAEGMTQLARVTNTGFNVKRIENLADSLTTVSAKSGASATGVLQFSKYIAPMASAAGIGTTKIMGISAAFSKLGEDGPMAANAFNKMMGDLNKSVRDGSPMLANYASIVGKTQSQFLALAKSDPTEAITQVTEAISKAGNAGPRLLEQLGLEGPRTARVLQEMSASGGLRQSVADSVGAYGNGSTESSSKEAYKGLISEMERFGTTVHQVADNLGGPFLNMLTSTVKIAGVGVGGVRRVTESHVVQDALKGFAAVGLPALMALRFLGGGVRAAFAGQVATSGPVRGFFGGAATGYAAQTGGAAEDTFAARRLGGGAYLTAAAAGNYGRGRMVGVNQAFERAGARVGSFLGAGSPSGGPGFFTQLRGAGVAATATYMKLNAESARLAATPFEEREFRGTPQGRAFTQWQTNSAYNTYLRDQGQLTRGQFIRDQVSNTRALAANVGTEGGWANTKTLGREFGRMSLNTMGALDAAGAKLGGSLLSGLGGPVGIGLTGAMMAMQFKGMSNAETDKREAAGANATGFLDDYRVAMGKATDAVNTFAGAMGEATKKAGMGGDKEMDLPQVQALAAQGGVKSRVHDYSGMSTAAVAAQVRLARQGGGLGPEEISRIEMDMFNSGFGSDQVKQFRSELGNGAGDLSVSSAANVGDVARQQASQKGHGWRRWVGGFEGMANAGAARLTGQSDTHGSIDTLTKRQVEGAASLVQGIDERFGKRSTTYNVGFARHEQFAEIDEAVRQALSVGNRDYAEQLENQFTKRVGLKPQTIDSHTVQRADSFTQALADRNKDFRTGIFAEAQKGGSPTLTAGWTHDQLALAKNPLARFFDQTGTSPAQHAVQALVGPSGRPEDPKTQLAATNAIIEGARAAGMSLDQLNNAAGRATNTLGDVSDANAALVRMVREAVSVRIADERSQMSSTGAAKSRIRESVATAMQAPESTTGLSEVRQAQQAIQQEKSAAIDRAQARVAQQRENDVQEKRSQEDFTRQMRYAEEDYQTSRDRTIEAGETAVFRTRRQYRLQTLYAEQDFHRQRIYAEQDFAKTMARAAEDGAKAMYSPYQRIAVQPTWDAPNMLGNLTEQNQAINAQLENLGKLRQQGGSSSLIKLLGLNDPANAQQLASLVGDVTQDPKVLTALNAQAKQRYKLGGQLVNDKDNTPIARQKEDFGVTMKRQDDVFAQSQVRARTALNTTLGDMAADEKRTLAHMSADRDRMITRAVEGNTTMLNRLHDDIKRADTEITRDLGLLTRDMKQIMSGQTLTFKDDVNNALQGSLDLVNAFKDKGEFQKALDGLAGKGVQIQFSIDNTDPAAAGAGQTNTGNAPVDPTRHTDQQPKVPRHALGGIATMPHLGLIAEAGSPEGMIPLDARGADFFAQAMMRFVGADDMRQLAAAGGRGEPTYAGTTYNGYDYSQTIEHVTVVSQDPDEMGQKLMAKQRRANLTSAPQVR